MLARGRPPAGELEELGRHFEGGVGGDDLQPGDLDLELTTLGPGQGAALADRGGQAGGRRGPTDGTPAAAVAAAKRFAALAIQAFQASPQATPLPPAARLTQVVLISLPDADSRAAGSGRPRAADRVLT
jgi:hypothetical protein